MNYYTESVNQKINDKLKQKGVKYVENSLDSLKNTKGNAVVDLSNMAYKSDFSYMNELISICKNTDNFGQKIISIPVHKWFRKEQDRLENTKTPVGAVCRYIKQMPLDFKEKFSDFIFLFYNDHGEHFSIYPKIYKSTEYTKFINLLSKLATSHAKNIAIIKDEKKSANPVKDVVDDKKQRKEELEEKKQDLVDAIANVASKTDSEEEAWDMINDDEFIKKLVAELEEEDDGRPKFDAVRTARISKLNDEFLEKSINGKTVQDILSDSTKDEIPSSHLKISSINDEWKDIKFKNFQKAYDINSDILNILKSFSSKSYPVSILDINVEDTSTNMDYIDTYTVKMEDGFGKRFTLVFDIPKFKNNRFMKLRGNEKVMSGQLLLLPCTKTGEDTVQCVSNYNKIFIYRKGLKGHSYPSADKLLKTLTKLGDNKDIKTVPGDNSAICSKYELPVDYIDLASFISRIETKQCVYYFNQDEYYTHFGANKKFGVPYGINRADGSVRYYKEEEIPISAIIAKELRDCSDEFIDIFDSIDPGRLGYSEASILSSRIPLVIVLGYSLGLRKLINMVCKDAKIILKKDFEKNDYQGAVKFEDGYLVYPINYSTSMLFNGLYACNTESYSITDVDKRSMWLDFLDDFGGRILSDGLDNFVDLFIDPMTKEVCDHCKIPSNYFEMLIYANNLLADNKYIKHTDIYGNRYRTNEIVAGYFYKAISKSYVEYKAQVKRGRKVGMSMKRSAVIDGIFSDPMSSDLSILNPLLEIEAANEVSFKGLSGMNDARSYGLDKRTYDDSMVNKLALSTGFAANVGINRQTTIDMDIEGKRGYIKQSGDPEDMSITKTFSMAEAVTPFGTTHDDPFRSAMTFIQTSKHSMRTEKSMPLLITNGADEAMPYISSDTFAYKAKEDGEVTEITPESMVITYKTPVRTDENIPYNSEIVNLKEEVQKNSDGGFYITLKLDTDLKVGDKFKKGDVIAYDRSSFSNDYGEDDNLSYNIGVLAKVAILNTDEGFEDSTAISDWLSEAMATNVVVKDDKDLSKNTNVYYMAEVGQEVQAGDPLLVFQNSFDEVDANLLLKNITDSDYVSDLGRIRLKSKYTGVVQDIKIYRTCEIDEMSESLQKIVKKYERKIKEKKKLYEKYKTPGANMLDPDYKMEATGIMKNNRDGVKIVFYIKYNDKLSVGDKVVAQSANKGVIKNIFPKGLEPFSEYRTDENIHALFAARSFNARMVTSVWVSGAINKCMIELDRQVKEIMGIEPEKLDEY